MTALPSGTVIFLFTDIEGSTARWEQDAGAMMGAVQRHLALLDAAIAAHDGAHFKTIGDAVQAVFPTARDGLAAAVDAQRALAAEPWPAATGPLRVRMALHAGDAAPVAGDYLAPCLNRLARLLATGYGGQILLTDAVRRLLDGWLPAEVALRDLGRQRLRDLLEPEEVWQADIAGLPAAFPPLKSLAGHPTNLPTQPNPLVGREADLATLAPLLAEPAARLVTLTGPGGVGKTRLALQAAADALDAFPDGVFAVDCNPLADPALVIPTIAATLGLREPAGASIGDALVAWLKPRRALLLIDNVEHLLPAAPEIAALLAACPTVTIVATSREPLRLRAEREFPVAPLSLPDDGDAGEAGPAASPAVA
ncbi:MAG TPA: AAA family ATPase, partial [Thermomicrobiales bacterium]|nr:AAA family ATPase [Thermomicrobiales bacterium]